MKSTKFASDWRKRRENRLRRLRSLAESVKEDLDGVVEVLAGRYAVKKVVLFGSLAGGRFAEGSDIDIAVEGLDSTEFFEAMAAVNRMTPPWVDLKPLEGLDTFFRERVLKEGEVLYEVDRGE